MRTAILAGACLLLTACGTMPRDPDGTLDRVRAERSFRVGVIAGGGAPAADAMQRAFIARLAASTGARPAFVAGAAEPLLLQLEAGELDLVVGALAADTPWIARVALLEPLAEPASGQAPANSVAARNGENAWIMQLEQDLRAVKDHAR